jgi:hypothetical protein
MSYMYKKILLSVCMGLVGYGAYARECIKDIAVYAREERVNNHIFTSKHEIYNGKSSQVFFVDGISADYDTFYQKMAQEEVAQIQAEHQARIAEREGWAQFCVESKIGIYKKLLLTIIDSYNLFSTISSECGLEPFFVYSDTFTAEGKQELDLSIVKARILCTDACNSDTNDIERLEDYIELYTLLADKEYAYKACVQKSIKNAINVCTNTEQLKKMLTYLSQSHLQ